MRRMRGRLCLFHTVVESGEDRSIYLRNDLVLPVWSTLFEGYGFPCLFLDRGSFRNAKTAQYSSVLTYSHIYVLPCDP